MTDTTDRDTAARGSKVLDLLARWTFRLESASVLLAAVSLLVMMVLITVNAFSRYFLREGIYGTHEVITLYLMGMIVWFSMARTEHANRHVQIDLFARRLPYAVQRVLRTFSLVLSALTVSIILYATWGRLLSNWGNTMVGAIPFPLGVSWLVIVIGAALLLLRFLVKVALELSGVDTTADTKDAGAHA